MCQRDSAREKQVPTANSGRRITVQALVEKLCSDSAGKRQAALAELRRYNGALPRPGHRRCKVSGSEIEDEQT